MKPFLTSYPSPLIIAEIGAKYVILYIWGDDHCRSLMRCRHAVTYPWWDDQQGRMFHGNFWAHLEMDLDTGVLVEKENLLSTPESLYQMTDPDFMVNALKDDLILQLYLVDQVEPTSLDLDGLNTLADILGADRIDVTSPKKMWQTASILKNAYGFAATEYIAKRASDFCHQTDKKLLICLLCPTVTRQLLANQPRYDQRIANYLMSVKEPVFDMNLVHQEDYRDFKLSIEDYMKRYFIGHYNPAGNNFFAFSLKDTIVDWLDPKPITYRDHKNKMIDFAGYLPKYE